MLTFPSIKKVNRNNNSILIEFNNMPCHSSRKIYSERSNRLKKRNAEKVLIEENSINSCLPEEIVEESNCQNYKGDKRRKREV